MSEILLKSNIIRDNVIDELLKVEKNITTGNLLSATNSLISVIPDDFIYYDDLEALHTGIENIATQIKDIREFINEKVDKAEAIERGKGNADDLLSDFSTVIKREVQFWKSTFASRVNFSISVFNGLLKFGEALVDTGAIIKAAVASPYTALCDIGRGVFTGDWSFSTTKNIWGKTKSFVSHNYVEELKELFYNSDAGKWLDENADSWFKSDGIGCKLGEGIGYALPIIATGGIAGAAAAPTVMGVTAATAGFGKYTAGEWNKNSISIPGTDGKIQNINFDYDKLNEIKNLKIGDSTTIRQIMYDENKKPYLEEFKITSTGNGNYQMVDSRGKDINIIRINESNTAKGLVVGGVKGAWEGAQYAVGAKINQLKNIKAIGRVGLDALTGAAEVPFQSAVTAVSEGIGFDEAWEKNGGWSGVATNAGIAGGLSAGGELLQSAIPKLREIFRGETAPDIKDYIPPGNSSITKDAPLMDVFCDDWGYTVDAAGNWASDIPALNRAKLDSMGLDWLQDSPLLQDKYGNLLEGEEFERALQNIMDPDYVPPPVFSTQPDPYVPDPNSLREQLRQKNIAELYELYPESEWEWLDEMFENQSARNRAILDAEGYSYMSDSELLHDDYGDVLQGSDLWRRQMQLYNPDDYVPHSSN